MFLSPKIERGRGDFIDHGFGEAILGQIHGFQVVLTGITTLHANVAEVARHVDRQSPVIFFPAPRAKDPAELPFG